MLILDTFLADIFLLKIWLYIKKIFTRVPELLIITYNPAVLKAESCRKAECMSDNICQSKNLYTSSTVLDYADCQGGGAVTQSPAERFSPGSNPDLGFF